MEEDYQALLESGFPNTSHNIVDDSSTQDLREEIFGRNVQDGIVADPELEVIDPLEGDADGNVAGDEEGTERKKRRKNTVGGHMTDEEKKAKQRDQNRKAAEKSRSKKKSEFNALEAEVDNLQDENTRLRARLSALHSARAGTHANGETTYPLATPSSSRLAAPQDGTNVDYAYLDKIQSEAKSIRQQLIDKEHQLAKLRGEEVSGEVLVLRQVLLDQYTSLKTLQAEAASLESLVQSLDKEKEEMTKQTEAITLVLQARPGAQVLGDTNKHSEAQEGDEEEVEPMEDHGQGVQKALAEIRGWVDAAVRDYQTSAETAAG